MRGSRATAAIASTTTAGAGAAGVAVVSCGVVVVCPVAGGLILAVTLFPPRSVFVVRVVLKKKVMIIV